MRKLTILCLIFIALLTTGCATYTKSRASDLADCFTVRAGLCFGAGIRFQFTNYSGGSLGGSYEKNKIGYFGRAPVEVKEGYWFSPATILVFIPLSNSDVGIPPAVLCPFYDVRCYKDRSLPQSFNVFGYNIVDLFGVKVFGIKPERMEPPTPFLREKFFCELGFTFGVVGLDAGFNPVEFIDFLLGWTGLDITGDDR